ncbi:MAG: hypothetical protein ACRELT_06930, partial [Longimicrobiales bacterium]
MHNGRVLSYTWNTNGTLAQVRDSTSHLSNGMPTAVTTYAYNSANNKARPSHVTDPVNLQTTFSYSGDGQLSSVTTPDGHRTLFDYIKFAGPGGYPGQLQSVVEEAVTVFDSAQSTEIVTDLSTAFTYDAVGNMVTQTTPRGGTTTFVRDGAGRVYQVNDPEGHRTDLSYDGINRVLSSTHHDPIAGLLTTSHRYGAETLDTVIDPRNVRRQFTYDALGRMSAEIDEAGVAETHQLNLAGMVGSTTTRRGLQIRHTYDAAGRSLKTVSPAADVPADSVMNQYDAMGHLLTATNTRFRITRTYFANGLLKSEVQSAANGTNTYTHSYWYDAAGRRTKYA